MESYLIGSVEGYVPPYVASGEASSRPTSYAEANKEKQATFVDYLLPVLVLIFAFVAWYYLTFIIKDEEKWIDLLCGGTYVLLKDGRLVDLSNSFSF